MRPLRTILAIALAGGLFATAAITLRQRLQRLPNDDAPTVRACSSLTGSCGAHSAETLQAPAARPVGAPRMLVFSSAHCPACGQMEPRLELAVLACGGEGELARVNVDTETGSSLATTYDVTSIPSLVSVDSAGMEVSRITGVQPQLPPRRRERRYPRAVKIKMSGYPRKRPKVERAK